jgi:DNA-binding LacI/PurR family transcriptional regulator
LRTQKVEMLIVSGELLARSVIRFIESRRLKIPDDISTIFFDDCEEFKMYSPKLTAVRQINSLGTHMALERLVNELRNPGLETISIALKPELVIRDSCKTFT